MTRTVSITWQAASPSQLRELPRLPPRMVDPEYIRSALEHVLPSLLKAAGLSPARHDVVVHRRLVTAALRFEEDVDPDDVLVAVEEAGNVDGRGFVWDGNPSVTAVVDQ